MKKSIFKFLLTVFVFTISFFCLHVNSKAYEENGKIVRIGYYNNEVFEDGTSDDDIKTGYAYEYYRKISEYTGWKYEYVYGDFVSIYQKLLAGEVDLVAGLAYTPERSSLILYPDKKMGEERYGIVKHSDDATITSEHSSLSGKRIGVLKSAIVDVLKNFLAAENIPVRIITFNDYESLLSAFDQKKLDAMAAEIDGIYDRNHAEVLFYFGETDYFLGVNHNRPDLLQELNEAQDMLNSEYPGYLSSLRSKYYSSTLSRRAFTNTESEWIAAHETIRIGYLEDFMPFCGTDEKGNVTGIVSEVIPYLFKSLDLNNFEYEFISYSKYDDIVKAIDSNEIDIGFPLGGGLFFSEVDGLYLTDPVITTHINIVFTEKYKGSNSSHFAVTESNNLQYYYVKSNFPDSEITFYPTIVDCLHAVLKGEVTCTTLNGLRTSSILGKHKHRNLSFVQLSESEDNCCGVKIGNDGLLKLLNRGLRVTGQDYIQNLILKYSQEITTYTLWDLIIDYLWQVMVGLFIFALLVNYIIIISIRKKNRQAKERLEDRIKLENAVNDKFVFVDNITNNMREPISKLTSLIDSTKRTNDMDKIKSNLNDMTVQSRQLITLMNHISDLVKNNEDDR